MWNINHMMADETKHNNRWVRAIPVPQKNGPGDHGFPLLHLQDLITTGTVERGFYVASGERNLMSRIQESLIDLFQRYASGDNGAAAEGMSGTTRPLNQFSYVRSRRPSQIGKIIWVDSGNIFNPYQISIMARQKGLDPRRVLRAIKVGRPFTAFQFQQMLERVPNAALFAAAEENKMESAPPLMDFQRLERLDLPSTNAVWWTPLVIISDLMKLFYDPELPEEDLLRSFHEFLVRISHLRQRAIVLALLRDYDVPPSRRHLLAEVMRLARPLAIQSHQDRVEGGRASRISTRGN